MDANEYKDYLLGIVFYRYLSDSFLIKVYDMIYDGKGGVCFPKLKEQNAIVDGFRFPNHLITLHQRKLEELKKCLYKKRYCIWEKLYYFTNDRYNERDITAREKMRELIDSDANKVTKVFSTLL